jgi:hypothetical protein
MMGTTDNSRNRDSGRLLALLSDIREVLLKQEARLARLEDRSAPVVLPELEMSEPDSLASQRHKGKEISSGTEPAPTSTGDEVIASAPLPRPPGTQISLAQNENTTSTKVDTPPVRI